MNASGTWHGGADGKGATMRLVVAEIGADVGALVVDDPGGQVLLVDPHLSYREQMHLITGLLSDAEFDGLQLAQLYLLHAYPDEPVSVAGQR